jgi:hypothetical protein
MLKNELCNMKVILTVLLSHPRTNQELERCAEIHSRSYLNSSAYKSTAGSISIVWHPSRWIRNFEKVEQIFATPAPFQWMCKAKPVCPTKVRKWEETNIK